MRKWVRSARFWLVVQSIGVSVLLMVGGRMSVVFRPDSGSYVEASQQGFVEMLGGTRTVGYPLLLKGLAVISPDFKMVVEFHLATHLLMVFLFDLALRRFGVPARYALAISSGLLYTVFFDASISNLLTDSLGRTMGGFSIGCLIWVSSDRPGVWSWIALAFCIAFAYHVRPAYLFLLVLIPCLGPMLFRITHGLDAGRFAWFGHAWKLLAVGILPYLGFCLLRLSLVGHFGLVSFGGYNLVGIAAELIDPTKIESQLPKTLRPLADEIVEGRRRAGLESPFKKNGIDIRQWASNYNQNIWEIAHPAAVRLYGDDPIVVNERLNGLCRAVIQARPKAYGRFLVYNFRYGLSQFLQAGWVLQTLGATALGLFLFRLLVVPRPTTDNRRKPSHDVPNNTHLPTRSVADTILLIGLTFALGKLLLVVLVEMVVPRYVHAAGLFLPSVFTLMIFRQAEELWSSVRSVKPS